MANPIYNQMNAKNTGGNILQQFMQFKQNFSGNPQQQIQQLLNSGKVTQAQYDRAVQQAKALQKMLGI